MTPKQLEELEGRFSALLSSAADPGERLLKLTQAAWNISEEIEQLLYEANLLMQEECELRALIREYGRGENELPLQPGAPDPSP